MVSDNTYHFPLSKENQIKGNRRLAREKILQLLFAYYISEVDLDTIFTHAFFRRFNFPDEEPAEKKRLLKPEEIIEMEADVPIVWKEDDINFSRKLINKTLENTEIYDELITEYAKNWEIERMALLDRLLIHMALTELIDFEDIPPKVSVNEAIDIAKKYSTDKSSIFINGILDALYEKLKKEGKVKKSGRGLINR